MGPEQKTFQVIEDESLVKCRGEEEMIKIEP